MDFKMKLKEKNGKIHIGKFSFEEMAEEYGTPFYLYDIDTIKEKISEVRTAFGDSISLYYAMKANPNKGILEAIIRDIDGLDISSAGEMEQAVKAGYEPERMSFAGPGKTEEELKKAIQNGVGIISVESMRELRDLKKISQEEGKKANICLRINPLLLTKEFAVKMGGKPTQFGIDEENVPEALAYVRENLDCFDLLGIHVYAGTQCMSEEGLSNNIINTVEIALKLAKEQDLECRVINLGGGFGVSYYEEGQKIELDQVAEKTRKVFDRYNSLIKADVKFILELGRFLVAEAGIYVTRVVSEKHSRGEQFYVLDGGMNHHLAASGNLGATLRKNYLVRNLSNPSGEKKICHLVGPLCTSLDLMGKNILVESPRLGDFIGFINSGSYAFAASPLNFLSHKKPNEIIL